MRMFKSHLKDETHLLFKKKKPKQITTLPVTMICKMFKSNLKDETRLLFKKKTAIQITTLPVTTICKMSYLANILMFIFLICIFIFLEYLASIRNFFLTKSFIIVAEGFIFKRKFAISLVRTFLVLFSQNVIHI